MSANIPPHPTTVGGTIGGILKTTWGYLMLSELRIKQAKAKDKPYKLSDGKGLFLLVLPSGSKLWRLKYRWQGREKQLSLGSSPEVSLKLARHRLGDERKLLVEKVDPSAARKATKMAQAHSFRLAAEEWAGKHEWAPSTTVRNKRILSHLYRALGANADAAVSAIEPSDFLNALRKLEDRPETAHRARSLGSSVFQYAIAAGLAKYDPAAGLTRALTSPATKNRSAITDPKKFGQLLCDIDNYQGQPVTRAALQLIALTFVRPGELRLAKWGDFDLKTAQWEIPGDRTKTRKPHLVPLSPPAVSLLKGLYELTGKAPENFVFPSLRRGRPLSENTLGVALKTLGYDGNTHVAHGFRSSASTLLHELGFSPEVIETQLAHVRPGVGGIYNRSHLLAQRKKMMKSWARYLDRLKREL